MTIALDTSRGSPTEQVWLEEMSESIVEVIGSSTTPRMGRRSMALADIDPKYVSQSGIWEASEVETSRGSIRIQHLTASVSSGSRPSSGSVASTSGGPTSSPRFPKLEECAHFHYDCVELPPLKIHIRDDPSKPISVSGDDPIEKCAFSIEVVSGGQSWAIRRTHANIFMLDEQLHRCVWDRSFSLLDKVQKQNSSDLDEEEHHNGCRELVTRYLSRLSELPTNKITCGTVLSWLELDNRGRHIVSSDDSAINTPAVAAACAVRKYSAQAADEISFEVGDMISVIDMPPPEESIWWRGKRGFHVGFFPRDYVQVIGDKVPAGLPIVPSVRRLQRLSVTSTSSSAPDKPVLRKHGKLIAFFRSFILSRPSRRRLKQSGILRERVFSCDLAEHLLNTGNEIPAVLNCCAEFIEKHGIIDGVYRLSGITSNIQKLRNAFDEDKVPNLEGDTAIKQDIHAVSSLLKMYFRELPNPLCTYQLYEKFVSAAKASDEERLFKMREVVHELPPPHYRTLEYLMKHLSRVAQRSSDTGMTPKNMAIVWAPNLIRCRELEAGGVAALKGIGVQAVVTEYLIRHADLIFNDKLPANYPATTTVLSHKSSGSSSGRPKSLAISSPMRLMSLEEAQDKAKDDRKFIEVGGGPSSLPPKYHTVIELPGRRGGRGKRSPMGWKHFFSRNRSFSKPQRKMFTPGDITVITRSMPVAGPQGMQTNWAGRLRPVKSVESLVSSPLYNTQDSNSRRDLDSESVMEEMEASLSKSSPATPTATNDVHVMFHAPPSNGHDSRSLTQNPKTHNRSISHDSYFEFGEFRNGNNVYIDETLEEETMSQSSKQSLEMSSGIESNVTSPLRAGGGGAYVSSSGPQTLPRDAHRSRTEDREPFKSPVTPPPSAASLTIPLLSDASCTSNTSSEDLMISQNGRPADRTSYSSTSPLLHQPIKPRPRPSKWRDTEVQTSHTELSDVGVCTQEDMENLLGCQSKSQEKMDVQSSTGCGSYNYYQPLVKSEVTIENENIKYELDRNSSFDESSEMSTPEEHFGNTAASTNIIYSPLVNEISSTSSAEQFEQLTNRGINNATENSVSQPQTHQPVVPESKVSLFVCPLYEAGITTSDLASSEKASSLSSNNKAKESFPEDVGTIPPPPQYENVTNKINTNANNPIVPPADTNNAPQLLVAHIYENDRIYQNQPIAPARKRPTSLQTQTGDGAVSPSEPIYTAVSASNKCKRSSATSESIYGGEHYENISETEYNTKSLDGHYEGNIYEDIEDSESVHGGSSNSNTSGPRYETISVPPPPTSRANSKSPVQPEISTMPKKKIINQEIISDDEGNSYESVRYSKVENQLLPLVHHYSEIEERPEDQDQCKKMMTLTTPATASLTTPGSEDSSPSHSKTDDMVTYLEVQTPCLKLRSDSLEDEQNKSSEDRSYESVAEIADENVKLDNILSPSSTETLDTPTNSNSEEGEIRHIDSPLVTVENPLYSLEMGDEAECEGNKEEENQYQEFQTTGANKGEGFETDFVLNEDGDDNDNDISMNESSISLSISLDEEPAKRYGKTKKAEMADETNTLSCKEGAKKANKRVVTEMKLLGRCNSAPLAETRCDFIVTEILRHSEDKDYSSMKNDECQDAHSLKENMTKTKISLCKRLSEPSLLLSKTDDNTTTGNSGSNNNINANSAWKLADAKRLANRKQSVKELLSKFETRDSPSPTSTSPSPSQQQQLNFQTGPGLPKPGNSCGGEGKSPNSSCRNKAFGGSGRFQHHRFSMGDILMTQSMSSAEDLNAIKTSSLSMVRSDTFPELRSSAESSASKENVLVEICGGSQTLSDGGSPLVAEKVQQALRVAMSSVDMNDPSTRERIEKYKEERRMFLRQKITSELTGQRSPSADGGKDSPSPPSSMKKSLEESRSFGSSFGGTGVSDSFSSIETVFSKITTTSTTTESNNSNSNNLNNNINNSNSNKSCSESPRKRAFSEDIPPAYSNSKKTIKTEGLMSSSPSSNKISESRVVIEESEKTAAERAAEEINVKEKIAMWTLQKKEMSRSTISCAEMTKELARKSPTPTGGLGNRPLQPTSTTTTSNTTTTTDIKFVKPILRREVTTSSIEISKSKVTRVGRSESAKKIKDMAAFFENKQF